MLQLSTGTYKGNVNYNGKAITVKGIGKASIIKGTGSLATVIFNNNEGFFSLLDQVAITGGLRGGAILVSEASPRINRSWIISNKALGAGSGVYIFGKDEDGNSPSFFNNIIVKNKIRSIRFINESYPIYIEDSSPNFINNTIAFNQHSVIFITGNASPRFTNNIIGYSRGSSKSIGVEFSDYNTSSTPRFDYNLFYRNKFDIKLAQTKYKTFDEFVASGALPNAVFNENVLGDANFVNSNRLDFRLGEGSAAIDTGNPDEFYNDLLDNSRNDIGASGGLFIHPDL